jgi:hypothetical protein
MQIEVRSTSLHATHARVGDDKFDSDSSRSRDRGDIIWLVVDPSNNQAKCLGSAVARIMQGELAYLGYSIQRTRYIEDTFGITGNRLGNGDSST